MVDYPFDEAGYTSADDISRIDRLITSGDRHTVVWLPRFFSESAMDDLALLVKLDWLFTGSGDRWVENSNHLGATEQAQARGILENHFRGTMTSFQNLLKQAYGIEPADPKRISAESQQFDVLTSLSRDFHPEMPPAASLEDALLKIIDQAFSATYPSHPQFDPAAEEVTGRNFETVRDYVEKASTHRDGRVPSMPGNDRKVLRRIAGPLRVGKATEDHFLFGEDTFAYWAGELDRAAYAADPLTVETLQKHIDNMSPAWGLRPEARDLVVSAWALLRKRAWFEAGSAITAPALGRMRPNIELRAEDLPEQQAWDDARSNASKLFGYTMPRTYLTGANVADFATQVRTKANEITSELRYLTDDLRAAHRHLAFDAGPNDRLRATEKLREFTETLYGTVGNVAVINAMAKVDLPVAAETAGQIANDAARDTRALRNFQWKLLEKLKTATQRAGEAGDQARAVWKALQDAVSIPGRSLSDELSTGENRVVTWVVEDEPPTPPAEPSRTKREAVLRNTGDLAKLDDELTTALKQHGTRVHVHWWVE
ncbi:hypothetical protein ACX9NE_17105 [Mycobacterium sp. ML4]